ncbi:MAG: glycosyltransferase family 2 protein [Desulfuromonadales bacterium]|nr:glycosyltransferase family 2 protein [Desulfuromonadales bacterium]
MRKPSLNKAPKAVQKETLLTVVVPAYNEQEVILEFHRRLSAALEEADVDHAEILYVNDGSRDNTLPLLLELMREDRRIEVLDLSRNFGKEAAMTAGLDHAQGDAVIMIDADLQDPPEQIPDMVREWRQGFDVVYMRRLSREGETWLKKTTARAFYTLMARVSRVKVPENVGDFRLLSRRAVDALKQLPERTRFMKGLFAWIGFPAKEVPYHRDPRYAGVTKWNYWGLWNLAIEGITSFTVAPLKIASYIGFLTSTAALLYGLFVLTKALLFGDPVPGYPSLMVVILFLGGLQLLAIGVVGEYLGRMFLETKQRPIYLVNSHHRTAVGRVGLKPFDLARRELEALS